VSSRAEGRLGYHKGCGGPVRQTTYSNGYVYDTCSRCRERVPKDDIVPDGTRIVHQKTAGVKRKRPPKYDISSWRDVQAFVRSQRRR
jgi:hypothetical protein